MAGLNYLGIGNNDSLLIPEYVCDAVIQPLNDMSINIIYYKLDSNLNPRLANLNKIDISNSKAILMINYFGLKIKSEKYIQFAKKNNLFIIEDNAHSFFLPKENELGEIGHISITSPRKLLDLLYGAVLKINYKSEKKIQNFNDSTVDIKFKKSMLFNIKNKIKFHLMKRKEYENPNAFEEERVEYKNLDKKTIEYIENFDWKSMMNKRLTNYSQWQSFLSKKGIEPFFNDYKFNTIPLYFVGRCKTKEDLKKWLDWGWKRNIDVVTWPILPKSLRNDIELINLWSSIICFPIDIETSKIRKITSQLHE